ncbi:hypothetical protein HA41_00480 [Pantoea conspicua]|uniref:Uncharacterized protein n=1 Tax=Pantoea conspicua TaxID=472705 RepID=A0A1X1C2N3_9GAMM|nr:hypothetical protein HA41_00480 [Pantoea conspicua]
MPVTQRRGDDGSNEWNALSAHLLHCVNLTTSFIADLLVFGADAVLYIHRGTGQNLLVIFRLGLNSLDYAVSCWAFALQHNAAWSRSMQHFSANAGFTLKVSTTFTTTT